MSIFTPPTIEELQAKFDQYHVEGFIAQGGMGAVYLAKQISLDRPVAIKILPQEFGDDADYRFSFETEAKAMAKLNHSNLVGIYDFGEVYGMLYIVMEYVPGRSLFDTANGQQVDEKEAARLIADMSDGLEHAHSAGLLHRDIKPANVLIDDEAKPKIVDFGLAKPMGEGQTEGVVFGTPGYTAPEVITDPHAVDHRSDIFSMGVMLYEMLTGQLPGDPLIPASRLTKSDRRFDAIITKCIHPNPEMRYKTAGELSKALHELLSKFDGAFAPLKAASPALAVVAGQATPSLQSGGLTASPGLTTVASSSGGGAKGLIVGMLVALLIGGGAYAVYTAEPKGPTKEEIAKKKAAELEREEQKKAAERKKAAATAKKERERKEKERIAALEEEKRREEKAAKEEKEEEKRIAKEREEKEKKKKEEMARLEADKIKKEKQEAIEAKLREFDLELFLDGVFEELEPKFAKISKRTENDLAPILDRMERQIERAVRRHIKGKKGRDAMRAVQKYMNEARDTSSIPNLPKGIPGGDAKKKLEKIIKEYRKKISSILKIDKQEKEKLRKEYHDILSAEQKRMDKLGNKEAVGLLKKEIDQTKKLEGFVELFEELDD